MENEIDYSRLSWNIKCLREAWGETTEDLMLTLGLNSTGTIPQYESGKRIPLRDNLLKIAKHYHITENELIYGDFSDLDFTKLPLDDMDRINSFSELFLPKIESPKAMRNSAFAIAYRIHTRLLYCMKNGIPYDESELEQCMDFYAKAYNEDVPEAIANSLWWILFEGIGLCFASPHILEGINLLRNGQLTKEHFIKDYYLRSFDTDISTPEEAAYLHAKKAYLSEIESRLVQLLKELKHSPQYSDLADYYVAIRYKFGVIDNGLSPELNSTVGNQMLLSLNSLDNPYATAIVAAGTMFL